MSVAPGCSSSSPFHYSASGDRFPKPTPLGVPESNSLHYASSPLNKRGGSEHGQVYSQPYYSPAHSWHPKTRVSTASPQSSVRGHLYYKWALVLQMGTCTTNRHLYYKWALVLQMGTCTTNGHLYYKWALVLQVGQVGTCTTSGPSGHLYYKWAKWALVLQMGTCTTSGHL